MGTSIGGLDSAFDQMLDQLSQSSLKQAARVIHPPINLSSSSTFLRNEIIRFVGRNYGERATIFYPALERFLLDNVDTRLLLSDLEEPRREQDLKPVMKRAIRTLGFEVHDSEVRIPPTTRADLIGYRRRGTRHVTKKWFGLQSETETEWWYEFLGVELKSAKRGKDPMYRQASVYAQYFDNAFTAVTPLTLLEQGYDFLRNFYEEMKSKGIGIVLMTEKGIKGTVLASRENSPTDSKRRHLYREMELEI